ncbi:CbtB-domain containing protein [Nocardioides panacis]|uniref:CbtB-domain containing protein n=1 Tax=Nocardioides panacis TaxID=2849501 RepID=A0A975XYP4_9ACTN|nr:CbtB-domain containing protein [Nocardioides panacis]QWZ06533.1 CbtB-domain containing protein [Nocardioides panacis]
MTNSVSVAPAPVVVPVWAWALAALALLAMYVLLQENGALLTADQAMYVHEITHDARHALGVPCH